MADFLSEVISRFFILLGAPLSDERMLWAAIPLLIATLFMTLYFGKYSKEELGWNTAFGNTMVFLFVSINMIQFMYYSGDSGSWDNVFSSTFYLTLTLGLASAAFVLMLITYYHLLPKSIAFFMFSAPPVNVSVYVVMTIVFAGVPADAVTAGSAVILFIIIFSILKGIQILEGMASRPEGVALPPRESPQERLLKKLKRKNIEVKKEKDS